MFFAVYDPFKSPSNAISSSICRDVLVTIIKQLLNAGDVPFHRRAVEKHQPECQAITSWVCVSLIITASVSASQTVNVLKRSLAASLRPQTARVRSLTSWSV